MNKELENSNQNEYQYKKKFHLHKHSFNKETLELDKSDKKLQF